MGSTLPPLRWIVGPRWDLLWIWSGLPIGLALVLLAPPKTALWLAVAIMVLESAHVISPIVLVWGEPELRVIALRSWAKYIAVPIGIMTASFFCPLAWASPVYWTWNVYHFGMQNFGVTSLYLRGHCEIRKWLCFGVTAFGMGVIPWLTQNVYVGLLCTGIFSFNHWLVDVGLSSRVSRRRYLFIAAVLVAGIAWLLLRNGPLSVKLVPQIIVIRYGFGFVHFLYEGWIWRRGSPAMRAVLAQ